MSSRPRWTSSSRKDLTTAQDGLQNGTCEADAMVALHCQGDEGDRLSLSNDSMSEISTSDLSLPEVCVSTNSSSLEDDMSYEVQQAYRIFAFFLLDKHKGVTGPFLNPVGHQEAQHGVGGVRGRGQAQLRQSMCLRRMEEKFSGQEYETITEFVTDFRLMLENCYRYHGVDHWVSKQGQKLEIMLEQKLTLLSRTLREKTTLAVTSKGRFGTEEDRGSTGTSTRRRLAPRSLATMTVGGHESVMVQTLRLEEQQRAKEEKRQRELEKKEAEEMSAKEVEEWEQKLLSQACPQAVDRLWELPAVGHFLCLAQTALNLPEVVFFELERCLLMPRCSLLLSKIMSSLLSPSQRRATLHRRPALPYHRWESELRQRVAAWFRSVGASRDQPRRAEQLGLCHHFFRVLGQVSPLEAKPFHLLPFYQRVWLLKGLCDHVYETQKDVQDAVLAQPIHECRESILGYDSKENAYIHFPHFCGADLRIYCQSPSTPPAFPFPSVWVRRVEKQPGAEGDESDGTKDEEGQNGGECFGASADGEEPSAFGKKRPETLSVLQKEKGPGGDFSTSFELWSGVKEEVSASASSDSDSADLRINSSSFSAIHVSLGARGRITSSGPERQKRLALTEEQGLSLGSVRTIKAETREPCLNVGEHSYTGRSPARSPSKAPGGSPRSSCCRLSSESPPPNGEDRASHRVWTKKRRRKKKRGMEQLLRAKGENKHLQPEDKTRPSSAALRRTVTNMKRKDKKKKHKTGKKSESSKKIKPEAPIEPSFKLVCTSLEELRDLISKTEDELDDLESTKKRLGRWYYRKEAVKDLHSTLIRLLNELSPWEPKLIKAYQRNRLRLKKEFDDFKKHPDYNNFVREECVSSSSDDDDEEEEDEERELMKEMCSEEEDLDHLVPRGLWRGASTRELGMELPAENHLTHSLGGSEKDVDELPRAQTVSLSLTSADSRQSGAEMSPATQSGDSALVSHTSTALRPASGLPKGYTPIPTLLAKSVGNKVTLMKRPAGFPSGSSGDGHGRAPSLPPPAPTVGDTIPSKAQSPPSDLQQEPGQSRTTAALPKSTQTKPTQSVPKSPIQVVYKVPEGLGHLVKKDSSGPIKFSVHPVVDHHTGDKVMPQVVILPSNLLLHSAEAKAAPVSQQQSGGLQEAVSTPLRLSTDVPGFSIPENRIPVQQVAPLRDTRTVSAPPSVPPCLPQGTISTAAGVKGAPACSVPVTKPAGLPSSPPPVATLSSALSTEPVKAADPKQELKTVCIRDSQSILVTTRGGNTGIVKVQTSSDQSGFGSFPSCPVITISPQFKAFLVSKTSQTLPPPAPSQPPPSSVPPVPSLSSTHSQQQPASVFKPRSTVSVPFPTAVAGTIPRTDPGSLTHGADAVSQGPLTSARPQMAQLAPTAAAGCQVPAPVFNAAAPALSGANLPPLPLQEFVSKMGLKRASTDEGSQVPKFILVTPSSSSASNMALPKGSPTKSAPSSRVMIISQPTAESTPPSFTGSFPKQSVVTALSGPATATSASSHPLKMAASAGSVPSEAMSITPPSGFQIQLSGKTTTIGQSIGALSLSPSKGKPVSGCTGPVPVPSLNPCTHCPLQLGPHGPLATSSPLRAVPSLATLPQATCSAVPALPGGNATNTAPSIPAAAAPALVQPAADSSSTQTSTPAPGSQHSFVGGETLTAVASSPQVACNKVQAPPPPASASCSPFSTSTSGTVQQRLLINTSTPLAAGTQILLNNACFVVPPQGLGPGSHVLIISSPAPPQVPAASAASSGASAPPPGAGNPPPSAPGPPQPPAVPAVTPPFVAPLLLSAAPHGTAGQLTGFGSPLVPMNTTVASALPRFPAVQAASVSSPAVDSLTLVSPPPKLDSLPALVTPAAPSAAAFSSTRAAIRSPAGPSAVPATGAPAFPRLAGPLSSLAVLSGPPPPAAADRAALHRSVSKQQVVALTALGQGLQPQKMAVGVSTPSTAALLHVGLGNASIRTQTAVMQTVLSGPRTQVLPTVAVPPIISTASRIQTLPVATVPPIGSSDSTVETSPVGTAPSFNSTVAPGQPVASLKTSSSFNSPWCGKLSPGVHANMASRLLVSPDGAVLSVVQSPGPSATPLEALQISSNGAAAALQTRDSSLQPVQADTE